MVFDKTEIKKSHWNSRSSDGNKEQPWITPWTNKSIYNKRRNNLFAVGTKRRKSQFENSNTFIKLFVDFELLKRAMFYNHKKQRNFKTGVIALKEHEYYYWKANSHYSVKVALICWTFVVNWNDSQNHNFSLQN